MGYFKRRTRSTIAARQRDRIVEPTHWLDPALWSTAPAGPPGSTAEPHYLRLAVEDQDADSGQPMGIFWAIDEMRRHRCFTSWDNARARRAVGWFNRNLVAPRGVSPAAVFWFKADARKCLSQVWAMIDVLRAGGREVKMMTSRKPGRIVYEDEHQVAAVPPGDLAAELRELTERL